MDNGRQSLTPNQREKVLEEHGYMCDNCHAPYDETFNIHHIVPVSNGGTNNKSNLSLLCRKCHVLAHKKTAGRKPNVNKDRVNIIKQYIFCLIGENEYQSRMEIAKRTYPREYAEIKDEYGFIYCKNKRDTVSELYNGNVLGFVKYEDETCFIYYNDNKELCIDKPLSHELKIPPYIRFNEKKPERDYFRESLSRRYGIEW